MLFLPHPRSLTEAEIIWEEGSLFERTSIGLACRQADRGFSWQAADMDDTTPEQVAVGSRGKQKASHREKVSKQSPFMALLQAGGCPLLGSPLVLTPWVSDSVSLLHNALESISLIKLFSLQVAFCHGIYQSNRRQARTAVDLCLCICLRNVSTINMGSLSAPPTLCVPSCIPSRCFVSPGSS